MNEEKPMSEEQEKKVSAIENAEEKRQTSEKLSTENQSSGNVESPARQPVVHFEYQSEGYTLEGDPIYSNEVAERIIRRKSRRSFVWAACTVAGAAFGINWLSSRRKDAGVQWPFRIAHEFNEGVYRELFSTTRLSREFPADMAQTPQVNGSYGVDDTIGIDQWELRLIGLADMSQAVVKAAMTTDATSSSDTEATADSSETTAPTDKKGDSSQSDASEDTTDEASDTTDASADENPTMKEPAVILTLAQLKAMPKKEMVTEFKCIEGWSYIVRWAGVPLSEVMAKYAPLGKDGHPATPVQGLNNLPDYVGMETIDGAYYVGFDMASAIHPQTLLCYEMNGKPLPAEHGGPLRVVCPTKYNIKNIKQVAVIRFTNDRPKDYWANDGYDWYAGH